MAEMNRHAALGLGEQLRAFRMRRRIKQEAVAADLGISQATVSRLESGVLHPAPGLVATIERLLSQPENLTAFDRWCQAVTSLNSLIAIVRMHPYNPQVVSVSAGLGRVLGEKGACPEDLGTAIASALRPGAGRVIEAAAPRDTSIELAGTRHPILVHPVIDEVGTPYMLMELRPNEGL